MPTAQSNSFPKRPFKLIGELMNNSFARAGRAFKNRDLAGFQKLAKLQTEMGADYLTLNIDGTQSMMVKPQEMLDFLPDLIPAIQEVTSVPIAFDNPAVDYHICCLEHYDPSKSGPSIFNSVSASRERIDEIFDLIRQYDTLVIGMASERFTPKGSEQCFSAAEVYEASQMLVERLRSKSGRTNDQIFIDTGLAPVGADTYGLVNMGLDAMRLIRADADLEGLHLSVGLTNFSFGVPRGIREGIENAYLTLACEAGLDVVLGNPEKDLKLLSQDDNYVRIISEALESGRPQNGETQEDAGFRQAEKIMELF